MPKSKCWSNIWEWSLDQPYNTLPFFVYLSTINKITEYSNDEFETHYIKFIEIMELQQNDCKRLKSWCHDQFIHHYECSH